MQNPPRQILQGGKTCRRRGVSPAGPRDPPGAGERRYGTKEGLPSDLVKAVAKDRFGFVWLATDAGLVRFDGVDFDSYAEEVSFAFGKSLLLTGDGPAMSTLGRPSNAPGGPEGPGPARPGPKWRSWVSQGAVPLACRRRRRRRRSVSYPPIRSFTPALIVCGSPGRAPAGWRPTT
jgi:hypothetical protein